MPDIVLHNEMGLRVLRKLNNQIVRSINYQIFKYGIMLPDYYMSYRFFLPHLRHNVNMRGAIMHEKNCQDFFVKLAKISNNDEAFSILCGVLCHFALDSTLHPLINRLAEGKVGLHEAIEHNLDMIELQKLSQERCAVVNYFTPYFESPEIEEAMKTVYGWGSDHLKAAHRHQKLYYRICSDRFGFFDFLFHNSGGKLSSISYNNRKCSNMDLACFTELVDNAVDLAIQMITVAYGYCNGTIQEIDFYRIIGNRTYLGAIL